MKSILRFRFSFGGYKVVPLKKIKTDDMDELDEKMVVVKSISDDPNYKITNLSQLDDFSFSPRVITNNHLEEITFSSKSTPRNDFAFSPRSTPRNQLTDSIYSSKSTPRSARSELTFSQRSTPRGNQKPPIPRINLLERPLTPKMINSPQIKFYKSIDSKQKTIMYMSLQFDHLKRLLNTGQLRSIISIKFDIYDNGPKISAYISSTCNDYNLEHDKKLYGDNFDDEVIIQLIN